MLIQIFESLLYENMIWFFYFIFERLGRMHENKIFFLFLNVLTKTGYSNIRFVSLQYKNTNQYWLKIFAENHRFFKIIFEDFFFVVVLDPTQKETRPKLAKNEIRPTFYRAGLSPTMWAGLSSPKEQLAGYCAEHSNQVIIISWLLCWAQ
jgi:hypothetical protein